MAKKAETVLAANNDQEPQVVKREVVKAPTFASIYTNDIQIQTSPWDLRLQLGEISEFPTRDTPVMGINLLGEVRMSPQIARRLVALMIDQLERYEKNFGKIPAANE